MSERETLAAAMVRDKLVQLQNEADEIFKGRRIRFVGKFNGQPYGGRSRKPLAGNEAVITMVCLSDRDGVTFCSHDPEWINAGFTLDDVEFL